MVLRVDELLFESFVEQFCAHRPVDIRAIAHDLVGVEILVVRPDPDDATRFLFSFGDFQHRDFTGAFWRERACTEALLRIRRRQDRNISVGEILTEFRPERAVLDLFANSLGDGECTVLLSCRIQIGIEKLLTTRTIGINQAVRIGQKISIAHDEFFLSNQVSFCVIANHSEKFVIVIPIQTREPLLCQTTHAPCKVGIYLAPIALLMEIVGIPLRMMLLKISNEGNDFIFAPFVETSVAHGALSHYFFMFGQHLFKNLLIGLCALPRPIESARNIRPQILIRERIDLCLEFGGDGILGGHISVLPWSARVSCAKNVDSEQL
ncbi:MAG: hypothetical protein ACOY82_03165 [Pseudomonadota bacterium]